MWPLSGPLFKQKSDIDISSPTMRYQSLAKKGGAEYNAKKVSLEELYADCWVKYAQSIFYNKGMEWQSFTVNVNILYHTWALLYRDTKMSVLFAKVPVPEYCGKSTGVSSTWFL